MSSIYLAGYDSGLDSFCSETRLIWLEEWVGLHLVLGIKYFRHLGIVAVISKTTDTKIVWFFFFFIFLMVMIGLTVFRQEMTTEVISQYYFKKTRTVFKKMLYIIIITYFRKILFSSLFMMFPIFLFLLYIYFILTLVVSTLAKFSFLPFDDDYSFFLSFFFQFVL